MKADTDPSWLRAHCDTTTPKDRRNQFRVVWAMAAWAIASVVANQLIKRDVLPPGGWRWAVAAVSIALAVPVLLAYARFLREGDELQRIIQLQALAFGFGGTFFVITGYKLFERIGAASLDLGDLVLVMAVLYSVGSYLGWRKYR